MKYKITKPSVELIYRTILALLIILYSSINCILIAQDSEEKEIKKAKVKMQLNYYKKADGSKILTMKARTKVDRKFKPVNSLEIKLFSVDTSGNVPLGSITTNESGKATFQLPDNIKTSSDTLNEFIFIAEVKENGQYYGLKKELTVKEANIEILLSEDDSLKQVKAVVYAISIDGENIPSEEIEVKFYVKRMFGLLPIGGDYTYTDENGVVEIEFPNDLPSGPIGSVTIIARIEDDENYGNIEAMEIANWGVAIPIEHSLAVRELWSVRANAPVYLIVVANSIIIGVWSVLIYIFFQLRKIRRISKNAA